MNGGEEYAGRPERIRDEDTLARFVESPWSDPRAVVDSTDLAAHLAGGGDRRRYLLGRRATASMVVLPHLNRSLGEHGVADATATSYDERGSSS